MNTKKIIKVGLFSFFLIGTCLLNGFAMNHPFSKGETIIYDIKSLGVNVGKATLEFKGLVEVDNQKAILITLTVKSFKFIDEENIFLDPVTFYPIVIQRDLTFLGNDELITEYYDQKKREVRIVKKADDQVTEQIIKKGDFIDNIYGFIYRYRKNGAFKEGENLKLNLPTKEVDLQFVGQKRVKAGGKKYEAYYIQSPEDKYDMWFDLSENKIPLRIEGAIGFGKSSMVLESYQK